MASTIIVLSEADMGLIVDAYPLVANRLRLINDVMISRCRISLDDYAHSDKNDKTYQDILDEVIHSLNIRNTFLRRKKDTI